jgi:hypothetical protein
VRVKFDQDPDPNGSALAWLPGSGSGSALRYRYKAVSGSALKPMRIHNTVHRCFFRQEGHVHRLQHADRGCQVPGPHQLWRYNRNSQQLLKLCHSQLGELIINSKARKEDNVFHLYLHRYFRAVRKPKYLLPAGFRICINLIRIRIQHFILNTDPNPGILWPKIEKNLQLKKKITFFISF